jgi:hypothetical protein
MTAAVFAIAVPSASAQAPTRDAYGGTNPLPPLGEVQGNVNTGGDKDVVPPPGGVLGDANAGANNDVVPAGRPATVRENAVDAPVATGGSLPFTGFDAWLIAGGGILMLGFGAALRRLSSNQ